MKFHSTLIMALFGFLAACSPDSPEPAPEPFAVFHGDSQKRWTIIDDDEDRAHGELSAEEIAKMLFVLHDEFSIVLSHSNIGLISEGKQRFVSDVNEISFTPFVVNGTEFLCAFGVTSLDGHSHDIRIRQLDNSADLEILTYDQGVLDEACIAALTHGGRAHAEN